MNGQRGKLFSPPRTPHEEASITFSIRSVCRQSPTPSDSLRFWALDGSHRPAQAAPAPCRCGDHPCPGLQSDSCPTQNDRRPSEYAQAASTQSLLRYRSHCLPRQVTHECAGCPSLLRSATTHQITTSYPLAVLLVDAPRLHGKRYHPQSPLGCHGG